MIFPRVYLAGPHTDDAYRAEAITLLWAHGIEGFDPIAARDFRGKEVENEATIVEGDLADVLACDALLGNFTVPGWGTGMETWFAFSVHKPIIAYVAPEARVSPWVAYVAGGWGNVERDLASAARRVAGALG